MTKQNENLILAALIEEGNGSINVRPLDEVFSYEIEQENWEANYDLMMDAPIEAFDPGFSDTDTQDDEWGFTDPAGTYHCGTDCPADAYI